MNKPDSYLIINGYTGAADEVNENVYKWLKDPTYGEIPSSASETLLKRGYLTERSVEEEREYVRRLAAVYQNRVIKNPSFLIAPTFSCQFRCIYCVEAHMIHHKHEASGKTMTSEHVKAVYAAIDKIEGEQKDKTREKAEESFKGDIPALEKINEFLNTKRMKPITLYGGEPLMAENYQLLCEIVHEGVARKHTFNAVTNAYDLLKYEDLLGPDKIVKLQITIDGPPSVHNKRRIEKTGLPTFDRIVEGVQLALDKGCTVSVRTNVDKRNMEGITELNQFYIDKGWNKNPKFMPYVFYVHSTKESANLLMPMELLAFTDQEVSKNGVEYVIKNNLNIDTHLSQLIKPGIIPYLRPSYCGANFGTYLFGPDGYIYTCWEEAGMEKGRIGTYLPELSMYEERVAKYRSRTIAKIPECLECAYGLICGGGCGFQAEAHNGSLFSPYCFQFRESFQRITPMIYDRIVKDMELQKEKMQQQEKDRKACA